VKWLENSIQKGFRYSYVLQFDAVWDEYRKDENWKKVIEKMKFKVYPVPPSA